MPIYKYKCQSPECGLLFEKLTTLTRRDKQLCRKCGSTVLRDGVNTVSINTGESHHQAYTQKEIDKVVGADADKKREALTKRIEESTKGLPEVKVAPKGGKINPESYLGGVERRKSGNFASDAYREDREKNKGKVTPKTDWVKAGFRKIDL